MPSASRSVAFDSTDGEPSVGAGVPAGRERKALVRPVDVLGYLAVVVAVAATLNTTRLLFLKQDANFDLKHYHAYLGWSLFHGGVTRDLHPALVGSYLNPGLDAVNYVSLTLVPASVGTALLLAIQLSSSLPVYHIARLLLPTWPRSVPAATAVLSLGGALVTSEWGTTFGDLTVAPFVLWGLWLLLSATRHSHWRLFIGGGLVGGATGLKLTNATFALASLLLALLLVPRLWALVRWAVGLGVGFLLAAGPWMIVMWRENKNPFFPYLNNVFRSPYTQPEMSRDGRFGAHGLGDVLLYPFKLVAAPAGFSSELPSSDWRWPVWAVSLVLVGTVLLLQLPGSPLARAALPETWGIRSDSFRKLVALQAYCGVAFALWAIVFGIQRYAIVIELLTVPVVVATLSLLTAHRAVLLGLVIIFAAGLGLNTQTLNWGRVDMPRRAAIRQGSVTALQKYQGIILAATPPSSFVAEAVGGDSSSGTRPAWFAEPFSPADARRGLDRLPKGRIGVLVRGDATEPKVAAEGAAAWFGLRSRGICTPVAVPLSETMLICETARE